MEHQKADGSWIPNGFIDCALCDKPATTRLAGFMHRYGIHFVCDNHIQEVKDRLEWKRTKNAQIS